MGDILLMILCGLGALFILLAAVGIVRMPDFYLRISVTTKAATLGIGMILIAAAIFFGEIGVSSRVVAIIFFLFITAPVGAHMIGRTAYFIGTTLWKNNVVDDLKGQYDKETHLLKSGNPSSNEEIPPKEE